MLPQTRRELYDRSDPVNPRARAEERQVMLDLLAIEPHHVVCDAPAWCGYLADGVTNIVNRKQLICVEPSPRFAAAINSAYTVHCCQPSKLPLPDASVDRFSNMVGLHHLPDRLIGLREAVRVLKPDGRLAISEVIVDTPVARFLNGPVDVYTMAGHRGVFLRPGECHELLTAAGCVAVVEQTHHLHWVFTSTDEMARFCQGLLGMAKASEAQVLAAIYEHFDVEIVDGLVKLPWSLAYAIGVKT